MNTEQPDFAIFSLKVFYSLGALFTCSLECCGLLLAQAVYCTHLFLEDFIKILLGKGLKTKRKSENKRKWKAKVNFGVEDPFNLVS